MKSFLIIIIFAAFNVCAQLTLPSIFSDNMVLQRDMKIPVWGKSAPEEQVGVWFHGQKRITTADKEGNWKVYLSPISVDNNPRKMMIKSGNSKIILTNVVLGDVWLCSGQSNMKFELKHAAGAKKFIAEAKESGIRFYQADRYNFKPYECDNCSGEWKVCATNNVRNLTAVGYLFGMEIHKKIGVPIGLIEVDFGGSIVESWMSAAVLQKWDYFKKDLAKLAKYKNPKSFDFLKKKETKKWFDKLKKIDPGFKNNWMNPNINASDWMKIKSPRAQKIECLKGHNGIVWFRKKIFIPKKFKGKNIVISFGRIVGYELTWLNGKMIDKTYEMSSGRWHRRYGIPATEFKVGTNTIVICDFANKDRGTPGEPLLTLSIYQKNDPSEETKYSSDWLCKKGYDNTDYPERPYSFKLGNNILAIHYNSRIYPIIPYAIRGVLWYQGESNQHNPEEYAELFSTMIKSWRERWGEGDFPFYFVQIAPFDYGKKKNSAFLREAQFKTLALTTNTGMAVIMDIGEKHNIHPLRKKEVGHRLALWALAKDYGYTNLVYSGPLYKNYKIEGDKIIVSFDHAKGLKTRDDKPPTHFEIAGNGNKFHPAEAKIINNKITVSSKKVKNPIAVRFAWSNTAEPNLCNAAGLPASSFRTVAQSSSFTLEYAKEHEAKGWAQVPQILDQINPPTFPTNNVLLTDFGGKGDEHTDNRKAFHDAINMLVQKGGGKIIVPQGDYLVDGPIVFKNNIHIEIRKNARVFFTTNAEKYLPSVKQRCAGIVAYNYSSLIYGYQLTNIAITGEGVIDGNGVDWSRSWHGLQSADFDKLRQMGNDLVPEEQRVFGNGFLDLNGDGKDDGYGDGKLHFLRPSLIHFYECKNILIKDVTIKNSPSWTTHTTFCKNVTLQNLTINKSAYNDDGIDVDSCEYVLIEGCNIKTGDDNIAIKAGRDQDAWGRPGTKNVIIRNNRLSSRANALCIGSEMSGGVSNIFMQSNTVIRAGHALCFKCNLDRGGYVNNVYIKNIDIKLSDSPMFIFRTDYHGYRGNHFPPKFNNFYVSGITCKQVNAMPFKIIGVKDSLIQRIYLNNIKVDKASKKSIFKFTKNIIFDRIVIRADKNHL